MACGRLLRDQESRRLRIGPHCLKRLQKATAPRPRIRTETAGPHPKALPVHRTAQLTLEIWGDDQDDQDDEYDFGRRITDVPTGAFL